MDKMEISVALIRKIEQRIHWLGKFNPAKRQVEFVIAHRLEKESWRESVIREVAWQLDIDRRRDFVVSNMAQLNIELKTELPRLGQTKIRCAFYNVELYRSSVIEQIDNGDEFVWLTSTEICEGETEDGIPVSYTHLTLPTKA